MKVQAPPAVSPVEVPAPPPYLPALDGLRALAVLAVLAYHLDFGWAKGGFLGVDLFFVISGYLITTILLSERDRNGRIDLPAFWSRRFRRLVPALALVVLVVILAFRALGLPEQWQQVRGDAMASLTYVANWRFIFSHQSYFESLLPPSPLRHMWSLAVEEQWYIVWPVVLALVLTFARARRGIVAGVLLLALGSALLTAVDLQPVRPVPGLLRHGHPRAAPARRLGPGAGAVGPAPRGGPLAPARGRPRPAGPRQSSSVRCSGSTAKPRGCTTAASWSCRRCSR